MSKTYLKRFVSDLGLVLTRPQNHPDGAAGYERDKALIRAIEREQARLSPLVLKIQESLLGIKAVINPPTPVVFWVLSKSPKPSPYFKPEPYLYVDVSYSVENLLTVQKDTKVIGELCIALVEEALSKLSDVSGFPIKEIQQACDEFREQGYIYTEKSGEAMIGTSKVKGRIDLEVSGAGTKRIFTASYRGKTLIKQKISEINWPEIAVSGRFHGFTLDGDTICVMPNPHHMVSKDPERQLPDGSARIDLNRYPKVLSLMRDKGWV